MSDPSDDDLTLSGTIFIPKARALGNAGPPEEGPVQLEVVGGPMDGLRIWSSQSPVTIGRSEDNDFELSCDHRVSGRHAQIVRIGPGFFLEDLDSRNGTLIGGHRIVERVPISPGATFRVGETSIEFNSH